MFHLTLTNLITRTFTRKEEYFDTNLFILTGCGVSGSNNDNKVRGG